MVDRSKSSPIKRFFGSPLFLLIGIPFVVFVMFGLVRSYYNGYKINLEISNLKSDIKSLEQKKIDSMKILNYVMSEDFVEEKARTELNMKKDGENVLVFKNQTVQDSDNDAKDGDTLQKMNNPLKWWYYFTDKSRVENNSIGE